MTDDGDEDERMIEILQEEIEDLKRQLDVANRDKRDLYDALEAMSTQMLEEAKDRDEEDEIHIHLLEAANDIRRVLVSLLVKPYCNGFVIGLPTRPAGYENGTAQGSGYWFFPDFESAREALMLVVIERIEAEGSVERN